MSKLSELDFQRLQETLLELKTRNYTLEDQAKKQRSALGESQAKVTVLQQELSKAQKTIEKSKKLAEVQKLLNENDNLGRKLLAQEEDFRLQNQTLLNELSLLVTANEKLEKQTNGGVLEDNVKEIENSQEKILSLKEELNVQIDKNSQLENELSKLKKQQIDQITDEFSVDFDSTDVSFKSLKNKESDLEDLKIELAGVKSENSLLQKHNEELKHQVGKKSEDHELIRGEKEALEEIVKDKQSTLTGLQKEKESIINSYEDEASKLKDLNHKLESQLRVYDQTLTETKNAHENEIKVLNDQVQNLQIERNKYSADKFQELQSKILCLENKLESSSIELERSQLGHEQVKIQLEKLQFEHSSKCNEADMLQKKNEEISHELTTVKSVSEKRKTLIDEMAMDIQKKVEEQREKSAEFTAAINKVSEEKSNEIHQLKLQIQGLNNENRNLSIWPEKFEQLNRDHEQLKSVEEDLKSQISVLEKNVEKQETIHESQIEEMMKSHSKDKAQFNDEIEKLNQDFDLKLELANVQKSEFEESVTQLKQEIKDNLEERKISEKKGHALVKDLKRQLQQERNKNEKLQERMKDCFETTSNASEPSRDDGDRTSVSSWSLMSGQNDRASTPNPLSSPSPFHSSNGLINEQYHEELPYPAQGQSLGLVQLENEALVSRVAGLQEDKWRLEERLSMLEQSGAEMATELVTKSELIQRYCMDSGRRAATTATQHSVGSAGSRSNPSTPSSDKVRNFVDKLDKLVHLDSQKEAHKQEVSNMQKMLEETLLKNLHLQQDLENMSLEIVRLSKLASPSK